MKTLKRKNKLSKLKTGVCALAITGALLIPSSIALSANDNASIEADKKVEKNTQSQTSEKRKEVLSDAVMALQETRVALKALDDGKSKEALAALEKATGKLEIILARDPALALAPTGVSAMTHDILGSLEAVKEARKEAEDLLEDGKVQDARRLIGSLASETVISTMNLPLATYPDAIKEAVRLIDADKTEEAKIVLQTALNTLVVTKTIIPLPVVIAENLLKEAEALAENKERTEEESKKLSDLLKMAENEIELAQALGYGTKKDFDIFYKEIDLIREKTSDGKSGEGFFKKIKDSMAGMFDESQAPEETTYNN
ncbi:MAG: hypothetical protein CMH31_01150 [Micavibrio sp.]|nr:hypothetical protein [Micavibrio sp.]